jgi:glycosyltransferase involved in cell wall biosynthesis
MWKYSGASYCWWNQRDEGRELFGSKFESRIIRGMSDIVSNSFEGKDFLLRTFRLPEASVRVINNAVLLPTAKDGSKWRQDLQLGEDDNLLTMVANLTPFKDHVTLLKAFAEVIRSRPRSRLALAGRMAETTMSLKALAFELGLSGRVHFLGEVVNVEPLYAASNLVVHSSFTEGCPNSVLEGMAHGKCVVGTDISGMRQALGDCDQFFAPARDAPMLAKRILAWLANPGEMASVGARNRERIKNHFSVEKLAADVLQGISRSLAARSTSS